VIASSIGIGTGAPISVTPAKVRANARTKPDRAANGTHTLCPRERADVRAVSASSALIDAATPDTAMPLADNASEMEADVDDAIDATARAESDAAPPIRPALRAAPFACPEIATEADVVARKDVRAIARALSAPGPVMIPRAAVSARPTANSATCPTLTAQPIPTARARVCSATANEGADSPRPEIVIRPARSVRKLWYARAVDRPAPRPAMLVDSPGAGRTTKPARPRAPIAAE